MGSPVRRAARAVARALPTVEANVLLLVGFLLLAGLVQQETETNKLPLLALWAVGMATMLLLFLPWYRKRSLHSSAEARRRQLEASIQAKRLAKKCCRNCGTEFLNQSPGGSKGEYKCNTCGLTSKRPRLLIPGEPDPGGDLSPRGVGAGEGKPGVSRPDKFAEKKREEPARQATKAELKERKQKQKEELRQRELEEEAERAELQRCIEEERRRNEQRHEKEDVGRSNGSEQGFKRKGAAAEKKKPVERSYEAEKPPVDRKFTSEADKKRASPVFAVAAAAAAGVRSGSDGTANRGGKSGGGPGSSSSSSSGTPTQTTPHLSLAQSISAAAARAGVTIHTTTSRPHRDYPPPGSPSRATGGYGRGAVPSPLASSYVISSAQPPAPKLQPGGAWAPLSIGGPPPTSKGFQIPSLPPAPPMNGIHGGAAQGAPAHSHLPSSAGQPPHLPPYPGTTQAGFGAAQPAGPTPIGKVAAEQEWLGMGASIVKLLNINAPHLPPAPRGLPPAPNTPGAMRPLNATDLDDDFLDPLPDSLPPPSAPTVRAWLESLGLAAFAPNFEREPISLADLPLLSNKDLERLGLPAAARRRLLASVGSLWQQLHGVSVARPVPPPRGLGSNGSGGSGAGGAGASPPLSAGVLPPPSGGVSLPPAPPSLPPAPPSLPSSKGDLLELLPVTGPGGLDLGLGAFAGTPPKGSLGALGASGGSSDFLDALPRDLSADTGSSSSAWGYGLGAYDRSSIEMWLSDHTGSSNGGMGLGAVLAGAQRAGVAAAADSDAAAGVARPAAGAPRTGPRLPSYSEHLPQA